MNSAKILFWDIETTHNIVATFPVFKANINYKCVIQDWYIISAAWKWMGKKTIHNVTILDNPKRFKRDYSDDYHVVKELHTILMEADAIIGHNGDAFDIKKFNTRAIFHGLSPLPDIIQIDTLKMARSKFKFTFNKLDYLAKFLGVGNKIKTDIDLWLECLDGDEVAIRRMGRYNKVDVKILEAVYNRLAPWCASKLNLNLFTKGIVCPKCGSAHLQWRGTRKTLTREYRRFQCECGKWGSLIKSNKDNVAEVK